MKNTRASSYPGKRLFDVFAAVALALLLSPVALAVAVYVLLFLGRPVFFVQERLGKNGRSFYIWKFRTMGSRGARQSEDSEESKWSKAGLRLRETSLDELPQLWNVLRGDMSLVGPRPLLVSYYDLYSKEQARRMEVLPGITGLAQVSGRNLLSWQEKFSLDLEYVDSQSFALDMSILLRTVGLVVMRRGISPDGADEVTPFSENR